MHHVCAVEELWTELHSGSVQVLRDIHVLTAKHRSILSVRTVYMLSSLCLCGVDVDGWLRGSKVARVKVCVVWPPPITRLRARNKMSAV